MKTTRSIAEYVGRSYDDASDFRTGMVNLELPAVEAPDNPADDAGAVRLELWKLARRRYEVALENRRKVNGRAYALVLGQCSQAVRNRIEAHADWSTINESSDVIELLRLIQTCMTQRQTRKHPIHNIVDNEKTVLNFKQGRGMSDNDYYQRFQDAVDVTERAGGAVGVQEDRIIAELEHVALDPDVPTEEEWTRATQIARDKYLAVLFLLNSDKRRYGTLITNISNKFVRGNDTYPTTLTGAYDYIVNYTEINASTGHGDEGGLSFYNEHDDGGRGGRSGRGTYGRGRGRSQQGRGGGGRHGRGRGQGGGTIGQTNGHDQVGESEDEAQFLLESMDNLEENIDGYAMADRLESCFQILKDMHYLPRDILLLDSCSTVCMICNRELLHGIYKVDRGLSVRCNAGVRTTQLKGYLGDFPEPVWFDPGGVANVLSLHIIIKYYRVSYDSAVSDEFLIEVSSDTTLHFTPAAKGLYAYSECRGSRSTAWAFVTTVTDKRDLYTKRAYQDAVTARQAQNIMMFPGVRQLYKIADQNLLRNSPITRADIRAAEDIFGPNLGALKGKTPARRSTVVSGGRDGVPPDILDRHRDLVVSMDIFFINKIPFLLTTSRNLHFGTVEAIPNRQVDTVLKAIQRMLAIYHTRGFRVRTIPADPEFQPLDGMLPGVSFNFCAQGEHVPDIERYVRTVKDRVRSGYNNLPFSRIPRLVVVRLVSNAVFWLNAFPHPDGVSTTLSPRYLITGRHLDYRKHVRLEFGSYAQTHEEHTNDMRARTLGAICLGPSGNEQGGHYFMCLRTGRRLHRFAWTPLPMPEDAITRVTALGAQQGMPKTLTFSDRFGHELPEAADAVDDDHDSTYAPSDHSSSSSADDDLSDGASTSSSSSSSSSDSAGDDDDNVGPPVDAPGGPAGVPHPDDLADEADDATVSVDDETAAPNAAADAAAADTTGETADEVDDETITAEDVISDETINENGPTPTVAIPDVTLSAPTDPPESATITGVAQPAHSPDQAETKEEGELGNSTGVGQPGTNTGVGTGSATQSTELDTTRTQQLHKMQLRHNKRSYEHRFINQHSRAYDKASEEMALAMIKDFESPFGYIFQTEQMSLKKGLKAFGKLGADAVVEELRQLDYMQVIIPKHRDDLSTDDRRKALNYLMYLKQKRCGRIKARGCADGRKQRVYKGKDKTSSPTVSTEALFLSCIIDAQEGRRVATVDIPGAFMHSEMDEVLHLRLDGPMAELLCKVDETKYRQFMCYEKSKPVLYVQLMRALYGTLQAALLFWINLSTFLTEELGFELNPYDPCVANKMINGKECTIVWHVDDLKMSHMEQEVLDEIIGKLTSKYGNEKGLTVQRGKKHEYLGMTIEYTDDRKIKFTMVDYIDGLLSEMTDDMKGVAVTPAASHLNEVNDKAEKLSDTRRDTFHHLTAKILYLSKRARPDLQTAVSFLTTQIMQPDIDDWKKLSRCLKYLRGTRRLPMILGGNDEVDLKWWIDASFAIHPDMRSHTGMTMSLGHGCPYSSTNKQKINTKSSTEAELVGVADGLPMVIWTRNFLEAQGLTVNDNVVYQDNMSAILLERNGRSSSGKRTRYINIRYFFVADRIRNGELRVAYCPTEEMVADFYTKPLQGRLFRKLRNIIMGLPPATEMNTEVPPQECVGTRKWSDVVKGSLGPTNDHNYVGTAPIDHKYTISKNTPLRENRKNNS